MLCLQTILKGVGVGNESASSTSAAISWVLKDGVGMFGGILFAWYSATSFQYDVKFWRLFADTINDIGLTLELVSSIFGEEYFLLIACAGCICRAMCGVAAGATRAAMTSHFALQNNFADLAAKEGAQETAVNLVGLVGGMLLSKYLEGHLVLTWAMFLFLTAIHIISNYMAVRSLALRSLNLQRAWILVNNFLEKRELLDPYQVSLREQIFWPSLFEVLWGNNLGLKELQLGASIEKTVDKDDFARLLLSSNEGKDTYILNIKRMQPKKYLPEFCVLVSFHKNVNNYHVLRAFFHASFLLYAAKRDPFISTLNLAFVERMKADADSQFDMFSSAFEKNGASWDINKSHLLDLYSIPRYEWDCERNN